MQQAVHYRAGNLLGAALYPLVLLRIVKTGPSTKVAICRKVERD